MPEKLPPEIAFNRITQEPRILGLAVSLLAHMPDTEKSISLLQTKMAERLTEAADSLSYERETLLRRIQTLEKDLQHTRSELADARLRNQPLAAFVSDIANNGFNADTTPTLKGPDFYNSWVVYFRQVQDQIKSRACLALNQS